MFANAVHHNAQQYITVRCKAGAMLYCAGELQYTELGSMCCSNMQNANHRCEASLKVLFKGNV